METKYTTYRNFRSKEMLDNGNPIFDTKGAVTACCEVDTTERSIKVGFSFLNPADEQLVVRGKGLAKSKLIRKPITLENVEAKENGKLKVTEALLEYLKETVTDDMQSLTTTLGKEPYRGRPEKCEFAKWLPRLIQTL